jgi:hypothetical protein
MHASKYCSSSTGYTSKREPERRPPPSRAWKQILKRPCPPLPSPLQLTGSVGQQSKLKHTQAHNNTAQPGDPQQTRVWEHHNVKFGGQRPRGSLTGREEGHRANSSAAKKRKKKLYIYIENVCRIHSEFSQVPGMVVHLCNPSYSG